MRQRDYYFSMFLIAIAIFWSGLVFGQSVAIDGPKSAGVGELCVFNLTSDEAIADWQIVPQADFYVDTAKRTLVFSTPRAGNYTIIAATILEGKPLVLTHACSYGTSPAPYPQPDPQPQPQPDPPKPSTLKDWVTQNIPNDGRKDAKYLADCFDSAASGMERGTIRTVDAAYASIRTCTQTKVSNKTWGGFFDGLEGEVSGKLGDGKTKKLAALYRQIAQGLRAEVTSTVVDDCPTGTCPVR
ncbi:MAG: hypothetical protein FWH27_17810 [Planctomycetaceae bacterium]|nr:hypothetical protein [Planctomycetaceae bacterium]